jgi:hypothetical protein
MWTCAMSTSPAGGTLTRGECWFLRCLAVDGSGGIRSGIGGPSFHQTYARTRPSPWTLSSGFTLPTSPAQGIDRASSATRSTIMAQRSTHRSRSLGHRRRKRRPRRWRSWWTSMLLFDGA